LQRLQVLGRKKYSSIVRSWITAGPPLICRKGLLLVLLRLLLRIVPQFTEKAEPEVSWISTIPMVEDLMYRFREAPLFGEPRSILTSTTCTKIIHELRMETP